MAGEWAPSELITPIEGRRGTGSHAGELGLQSFPAGLYPSCSKHGAMVCVRGSQDGESLWRCLVDECNIGGAWKGWGGHGCSLRGLGR